MTKNAVAAAAALLAGSAAYAQDIEGTLALVEPCEAGAAGEVIPVDIAAAKALAAASPVSEAETLELLAANGRVLATDAVAALNLPPFDASAMDGYAVRSDELVGPGPWRLRVTGRIAAGDVPRQSFGGSVRILTGAPVPQGFDAVVIQEKCSIEGDVILIDQRPRAGQNVRIAGEDVRRGEVLVEAGKGPYGSTRVRS